MAELTAILVSAFKVAWIEYYRRPENDCVLSKEVARPALAKFLVEKSRDGLADEGALAVAGLQFLIALETTDGSTEHTPLEAPSWHLSGKTTAHFVLQARIRLQMK